jgi:hypothetical protein
MSIEDELIKTQAGYIAMWKARAEKAEADLTACRAQGEAMRAALEQIANEAGIASMANSHRVPVLVTIYQSARAALSSTPSSEAKG